MRRFIAHIGAAKTGTTAFQAWLKAHRTEMMAAGYLVPDRTPRQGNHRNVVASIAGISDSPNAEKVRAATLQDFATHPELDVIVSAEALGSVEQTATLLPALTAQLDGFEKIAILSVRDPVAHYNSGFAQRRKAMRRNERDFEAFYREGLERRRGDWRLRIEQYESHGWRMIVLPYNAEAKARGITRTLLSLPEFGDVATRLPVDETGERNPSMGAIGLIVMDMVQDAIDPAGVLDTHAPAELRARVARIANERFDDRPFNGFTVERREELIAAFADTNRWTAGRFFDVPWEAACPPQPPAPVSPRSLDDLPDHVAKRVARTATRMTDYARELGGLERRAKGGRAAED
jgi:hypothetical protein